MRVPRPTDRPKEQKGNRERCTRKFANFATSSAARVGRWAGGKEGGEGGEGEVGRRVTGKGATYYGPVDIIRDNKVYIAQNRGSCITT